MDNNNVKAIIKNVFSSLRKKRSAVSHIKMSEIPNTPGPFDCSFQENMLNNDTNILQKKFNGQHSNEDRQLNEENSNIKTSAEHLSNRKSNRASILTVSSIEHDGGFIHNDLAKRSSFLDGKNSRESLLHHEPHEGKHKQPVMGKTALLLKNNADSSDSSIIHSIILNKYENILNYYVNRMYTRRISKISNPEDESSDNHADLSSLDVLDNNSDHGYSFADKNFNFMNSNNLNVEAYKETLSRSSVTCSSGTIDVVSTCSEYDPRRFLVDALGEVNSLGDTCNCASNTHLCEESVGTSQISSLISTNNSPLASSLKRDLKRKKSKKPSKNISHENGNRNDILDQYKRELARQHCIIFQISKALNYCKSSKQFFIGRERVEAEKILLVATLTKQALTNEINMLEFDTFHSTFDPRCLGKIKITNIVFHLKEKSDQDQTTCCEEYFLVVIQCGKTVIASDTMNAINSTVCIQKTFRFPELPADFEVVIAVYSLVMENKDLVSKDASKCPSPKTMLKWNKNPKTTPTNNSINYIETAAFIPLGKCHVRNSELSNVGDDGRLNLKWCEISSLSYLQPFFDLRLESSFKLTNKLTGFLTLGLDHGVTTWNRRWCVLDGSVFKYWNYPSEELSNCIGLIDLKYCAVQKILLADRSSCARPKTLFLPLRDSQGLKKYFLSADSLPELKIWENELNFVVRSLMIWKDMKNDLS